MYCGKCGMENQDGAKFCKGCGAKLGRAEQVLADEDTQTFFLEQGETYMNYQTAEPQGEMRQEQGDWQGQSVQREQGAWQGQNMQQEQGAWQGQNMQQEQSAWQGQNVQQEQSMQQNQNAWQGQNVQQNQNTWQEQNEQQRRDMLLDNLLKKTANEQQKSIIPSGYEPIGMWGYFGYSLLFSIPLIGLIMQLIYAFGGTSNINLRNFARAQFCVVILWAIVILIFFMPVISSLMSYIRL